METQGTALTKYQLAVPLYANGDVFQTSGISFTSLVHPYWIGMARLIE